MTDKHHVTIDRARREAKKIARSTDLSYQQALDRLAIEAGYRHWSEMLSPSMPLITPESVPANLSGQETSGRPGNQFAESALKSLNSRRNSASPLRTIPLNAATVAQALDPLGGPFLDEARARAHCPRHGKKKIPLQIVWDGVDFTFKCSGGCDCQKLQGLALSGLQRATAAAVSFMRANDSSAIYAGASIEHGGKGGTYSLEDGSHHRLSVLTCRMLPDGYPRWIHHKKAAVKTQAL